MLKWTVTPEESGIKLLSFLKNKLGESVSTKQIKRAIEEHSCLINERIERFSTTQLGTGDQVSLQKDIAPKKRSKQLLFENERVLYEDDFLLIYNKPDRVTSDDPAFIKAIHAYCDSLILMHRLDRETSGALLFAKSSIVQSKIIALFKNHSVKKGYLALVDGIPKKTHGTIDNFLGEKHRHQGQVSWGQVSNEKGLRAVTEWKILQHGKDSSLLACIPKTGRTHQIRIHLSEMGHPLLGDFQYGKTFSCMYRPSRHLLHAYSLSLPHPCKETVITVCAPLPDDFISTIKTCIGAPNYDKF